MTKTKQSPEFAKVFGSGDEQIVVMIMESDDGLPELRAFMRPKGLGVSQLAVQYKADDWKTAEGQFALVDEAMAKFMVQPLVEAAAMQRRAK